MSSLYIANTVMYMSQEEIWGHMYQNISNGYTRVVELIFFLFLFVEMIHNKHVLFNNQGKSLVIVLFLCKIRRHIK